MYVVLIWQPVFRSGDAFAVFKDKLGGLTYIQKISSDGELLWGMERIRLGK